MLTGIGKTGMSFIEDGLKEYESRLKRYVPFRMEWIKDVKGAGRIPEERQKELEGEEFVKNINPGDYVAILDEKGKEFTSRQFADWLQKRMVAGGKRLLFLIGGPYGFSDAIYERADEKLSLSKMTFNHEMVRLFFIEQLYRSMTILRNEPYHHD